MEDDFETEDFDTEDRPNPRDIVAYSHQPRWSDDKKKKKKKKRKNNQAEGSGEAAAASAATNRNEQIEGSGEGGTTAAATNGPPVDAGSIPARNMDDWIQVWDGKDVETETWRLNNFLWCRCGNCRLMPTVSECVCCHDLTEAEAKGVGALPEDGGIKCLLLHPRFHEAVIAEDVLHMALLARQESLKEPLPDTVPTKTYRLQAYRQVTYWLHGSLGKGKRRVIPSCVVWAIRKKYPSPTGEYTGYLGVDEVAVSHY